MEFKRLTPDEQRHIAANIERIARGCVVIDDDPKPKTRRWRMKDHGLRLQMRALCKQLGFELREYTATSGPWVDVERKENGDVPELQRRVASLMSDNKRLQERFDALLAHLGVRVELVCDRLTLFHGVPPKYAVLQVPLSAEAAADKALEETHGIDTDDPAVRSAAVYAAKLARGEQ